MNRKIQIKKNNRFRVDTGDHYNNFNTLEEAKAFAEKEYGGNSEGGAKKNSLENAKKMAESYRKTSNKPIYITEKDGDYVVAKGRGELEYAKENGYRLVPEGENAPLQHTSASQEVQESVYKDIKNNGLEDYTVEEIAKEYGTTRGDAEVIWSRLNNEDSAPRQLTGDCKITIKG